MSPATTVTSQTLSFLPGSLPERRLPQLELTGAAVSRGQDLYPFPGTVGLSPQDTRHQLPPNSPNRGPGGAACQAFPGPSGVSILLALAQPRLWPARLPTIIAPGLT